MPLSNLYNDILISKKQIIRMKSPWMGNNILNEFHGFPFSGTLVTRAVFQRKSMGFRIDDLLKNDLNHGCLLWDVPSGKHTNSYWKWPIEIVDLPIKHGGSVHSYVNVYQRLFTNKTYEFHDTEIIECYGVTIKPCQAPLMATFTGTWLWHGHIPKVWTMEGHYQLYGSSGKTCLVDLGTRL